MAGAFRALAFGCLAAFLLAVYGIAGASHRDAEQGIRRWCEGSAYWLGEDRARASCASARHAVRKLAGAVPQEPPPSVARWPSVGAQAELVVLRALSLQAWAELILPLWVAALLDAWLSRRADAGCTWTYPERAALAARTSSGLVGILPVIVVWPGPIPVLVLPGMGVLGAGLLWVWVRHRPGEVR